MLALAFFIVMAALIPLGIGPDLKLLAKVAGGVVWSAALLAALLSLDRLFQADYEDGSLDLIALSPLPLEAASFAKIAAHWLTTGLPLTVVSPLLGLLYGLPPAAYPALVLSLLIGTPAISAIGAVGASLTLPVRRGGLILPLLVLPLVTPALIFGAGAISAALNGLSNGAFGLLCAFSFVAVIVSPFITAFAVRPNLAG
ncbi:MAG: heme exporter protein CcmB [Alphaproteobacteria bacterium]|nr:heme exporter protein CcmB [Alphaproteobacteria bacterium]